MNDKMNIELRSPVIEEIMGTPPRWLIRRGIGLFLILLLMVFTGSYFFKYPQMVRCQVVISTENPPAQLMARVSSVMEHIMAADQQTVEAGALIAVIKSSADYNDVLLLDTLLQGLAYQYASRKTMDTAIDYPKSLVLGSLQQTYEHFLKLQEQYMTFMKTNEFGRRNNALSQRIKLTDYRHRQLVGQGSLRRHELQLAERKFTRDSILYSKGVISVSDYENAANTFLQQKLAYEQYQMSVTAGRLELEQMKQQLLDLELTEIKETEQQFAICRESYYNLMAGIAEWKNNYLFVSPVAGRLSYSMVRNINQAVTAGEMVFTVWPFGETKVSGKAFLAVSGAGKVASGNPVNVKLENYPYLEFGVLQGKVANISGVTVKSEAGPVYPLEIAFVGLPKTSYHQTIDYSREIHGTAEIITDQKRVISYFLEPFMKLLNGSRT
jgi:multidrug resistance efflux pump